jgi:hypothetical protein
VLALPPVAVYDHVAPPLPRRPRRQRAQVRLLIVKHRLRFLLGDCKEQLFFAVGEVMEQLALGRLGAPGKGKCVA